MALTPKVSSKVNSREAHVVVSTASVAFVGDAPVPAPVLELVVVAPPPAPPLPLAVPAPPVPVPPVLPPPVPAPPVLPPPVAAPPVPTATLLAHAASTASVAPEIDPSHRAREVMGLLPAYLRGPRLETRPLAVSRGGVDGHAPCVVRCPANLGGAPREPRPGPTMTTYYVNEAKFVLPDREFVDWTVHVIEAGLPGGEALGVVVVRGPIPEGKSLRDVATAHVRDEAVRIRGYAVLDETESMVAGLPAILVSARWRHSGKVIYQRQAHVSVGPRWLLFTATAPLSERAACDEALEEVLSSLVWRDG